MSADGPRATAEDGFTTGDDPREVGHDARDVAAEDAGDPAEFVEPGTNARAAAPPPGPGPDPELPNFVGRARPRPGVDGDPNGRTSPGGIGSGGGAAPRVGPGAPGPDGIPPAPTLQPGAGAGPATGRGARPSGTGPASGPDVPAPGPAPGIGGPPPAHFPQAPGEPPAPSPLASVAARIPRLPRVPSLRDLPRLRRRGVPGSRPGRVRGLRVNQRLWRVDPWSVFKISALFYFCVFLVLMVSGTLLWNFGRSTGTIDEFESFVARLGAYGECVPEDEVPSGTDFEEDSDCPAGRVRVIQFELDDGTVFRASLIAGVILVVAGSLGNVLMTVLLNLINEVSGGARYTIIKEPVPRPPGSPPPRARPDGSTRGPSRR